MQRKSKSKVENIQWEVAVCDNCGSKKYEIYLDNVITWEHDYKFREVKCEKCGLVYLSPRPKKESISYFYSSKSYWGTDLTSDNKKLIDFKKRSSYYGRIYKNILNKYTKGSIFDAGFGTGLFLTYFNEIGWKVDGIELSIDAVIYARKVFNLKDLKSGSIDDIRIKKHSVDVVTFNSSLEHLYSPKRAMKKANEMLKRDGLLVITIPNLDSLGFKIFNKRWLGLHPPKHLYHYTPKTSTEMLKSVGFKVDRIDHWYWNHSYYSYFESFRYMISPRFRSKVANEVNNNDAELKKANGINVIDKITKKAGIIFTICFAACFTVIGYVLKRGETITIYAKKN